MKPSVLALAISITVLAIAAASADDYKVGNVTIRDPWSRATPAGAPVAGGYMTITNTGTVVDRLVGGSAAIAGGLQVHQMAERDGVMTMRPLMSGLEIKSGETVTLKPGGLHVMFTNLKARLKPGERFRGTLTFEKAGPVEVEYIVQGIGASSADQRGVSPDSPTTHPGH